MVKRYAAFTLLTLIIALSQTPSQTQADALGTTLVEGDLILTGSTNRTIANTHLTVEGSLVLEDDASLTLVNSTLVLAEAPDKSQSYVLRGRSSLTAVDSNITWTTQGGIRLTDNSAAHLEATHVFNEYQILNRTLYSHGFGLNEDSTLTASNSKIGYLRLTDNASATVTGSTIGDFTTRSTEATHISDSTILKTTLLYAGNSIHVDGSLTGHHTEFKPDHLLTEGAAPYPFTLTQTSIETPPSLDLTDCTLETENTVLNIVMTWGQSSVSVTGSQISALYLLQNAWATVNDTRVDTLTLREGDFNVQLRGVDAGTVHSFMTTGLNLKTRESSIGTLNLEYAYPGSASNVELVNTKVDHLPLSPWGPSPYQFEGSTVQESVTLNADFFGAPLTVLTGGLSFGDDCTLAQGVEQGVTEVTRVYKVTVARGASPVEGQPWTLARGEQVIREGETDAAGEAVLTLTYRRLYEVIEDPQPGGPYLTDVNNLTATLTLRVADAAYELGLFTETPVRVELKPVQPDNTWLIAASAALAAAAVAAFIYLRSR
ncbi:hypothetical protein JXL21_12375 [Candidatus Bathyarchaeota archaeon]|nr:hypothetical protein [Candidatus Bathyarchaeota archaeon]